MATRSNVKKKIDEQEEKAAPRGRIKAQKSTTVSKTKSATINQRPEAPAVSRLSATPEPQQMAVANDEPKSFIVQNIMPGFHCVSDLGITFDPFEVIDLTYEDPRYVKASKDLKMALRRGALRKITPEQWEQIIEADLARERMEMQQSNRPQKRRKFQIDDDREIEADVDNINSFRGHHEQPVTTAGYANDPATYAEAFAQMSAQYAARGMYLDASAFAQMVQNNPSILRNSAHGTNGVTSGQSGRARATVAMPPSGYELGTRVGQFDMTNYNRDGYVAGAEDMTFLDYDSAYDEDMPIAEEIDLADDGGEDFGEGAIRRMG